jgi:sec-independent protein translocase protein TatB
MVIQPTIEYATFGFENSLILMVLALVVFGPRRLPEIGRQIGRLMYEIRKASNDFKYQMEEELRSVEEADRRTKEAAQLSALPPPTQVPATLESVAQATETAQPMRVPTTESPYPGEGFYPVVTAPDAQAPYPPPVEPVTASAPTIDAAAAPANPVAPSTTDGAAAPTTEPIQHG